MKRQNKGIIRFSNQNPFLIMVVVILNGFALSCDGKKESQKEDKVADDAAVDDNDTATEPCTNDDECSDGLYCNGVERCNPGAKDADERGCVAAKDGPCDKGQTCDEKKNECSSCTDNSDKDGDNHDSIECGGDDCDDNDPNRYPGNSEVCDDENHDEDCNPKTFGERDIDADGSYDETCCNQAEDGTLYCGDDCDDTTFLRHPGQLEICDEIDNDCDGEIDKKTTKVAWYPDEDGDGYGVDTNNPRRSCVPISGHSLLKSDCDDNDASRHPAQLDICDGIDNNCDTETDEDVPCQVNLMRNIGEEGGTLVQQVSGRVVLGVEVPAGAVQNPVQIRIEEVLPPVVIPEGYKAIGSSYGFTPHGTVFQKAVRLALPVLTFDMTNVRVLRLENAAGAQWQELQGVILENSVAIVKVDRFSYFQVVVIVQVELDAGQDSSADAEVDADMDSGIEGSGGIGGTYSTGGSGGDGGSANTSGSGGSGGSGGTGSNSGIGGTSAEGGAGGSGGSGGTCNCSTVNVCCDGCYAINQDGDCDDGIFCNGIDTCDEAGNCTHSGDPCLGNEECNSVCNDVADNCLLPSSTPCTYDDDPMTLDYCDGEGSCAATAYCDLYACWKVPPTSQTTCYNESSNLLSCPGTVGYPSCATIDFCGQDAQYPDNDRNYICKNSLGSIKSCKASSEDDDIVEDSLTHLVWQRILPSDYGQQCAYQSSCNWQQAVDYCNQLVYGGHDDWRLPETYEFASLLSYGRFSPASDFPETPSSAFWCSTSSASSSDIAWTVDFTFGYVRTGNNAVKSHSYLVRCVRGTQQLAHDNIDRFYSTSMSAQQIVLDRGTGLLWQSTEDGIKHNWKQALAYCEGLDYADLQDWRLPDINELRSLVSYNKSGGSASWFPGMASDHYWSSTPGDTGVGGAWLVGFDLGDSGAYPQDGGYLVRCVRGEP